MRERPPRPAAIPPAALVGAILFLLVAAVAGVLIGPVGLPPGQVLAEVVSHVPGIDLRSGLTEQQAAIVWQLRVPRVVLGLLVGGMLAVAGGAFQGVFRNPLADPYLLGVAAGAGLGATLVIVGFGGLPVGLVPPAAFLGAVIAVALTYALSRSAAGRRSAATLLLAGVAVGSFLTAVQTFVHQRASDRIREVFAWILGRLTTASWEDVRLAAPYVLVAAAVIIGARRLLDVLAVGEEEASTLGLRADRVRLVIVTAATLGTAAAVAVSGLIGFVGIVVPHAIRLMIGPSYRAILPLAALAGGAFLVFADLVARTAVSPGEVPIGVVTAFVGAPFFASILRASGREA